MKLQPIAVLNKNYCKFAQPADGKLISFMLVNGTNITEKNYRKLVLQIGLGGFSYCVFDTLGKRVTAVAEIDFSGYPKTSRVEDHYWKSFVEEPALTKAYDEVVVLHQNNLNTFVPHAIFDEDYLGSYLQYNTKVFETDFFAFDEIANYDLNNVYIPYVNVNNFLIDQFGSFDYRHINTVLVSKLLDRSKNNDEKQVFVHVGANSFEMVVVQNQKLLLFNSFEYYTKEDFIYYILFTAEQLNLNPEHFTLQLLGDLAAEGELFSIAYKYVRNVALLDIDVIKQHNDFTEFENRKHFILLNS